LNCKYEKLYTKNEKLFTFSAILIFPAIEPKKCRRMELGNIPKMKNFLPKWGKDFQICNSLC